LKETPREKLTLLELLELGRLDTDIMTNFEIENKIRSLVKEMVAPIYR
jgi:hypothetical protein